MVSMFALLGCFGGSAVGVSEVKLFVVLVVIYHLSKIR